MEVILKEDLEKLGHRGDVVKVADGYARNYLLPKKLAIEATSLRSRACRNCRSENSTIWSKKRRPF